MSRIGNNPIPLPPKVEVTLGAGSITVKGPLGSLTRTYGDNVSIEKSGDTLVCKAANEEAGPMHGTLRALEVNPLWVNGDQVEALDVLVITDGTEQNP